MKKEIQIILIMWMLLGLIFCLTSPAEEKKRKSIYWQDAVLEACALELSDNQVDATLRQGMHYYGLKNGVGPSPCFQRLLDDLTFTEFERPYLKEKLDRWKHLPFPVVWAILDRTKPLQTGYLMDSDFCDMKLVLPQDSTIREKIIVQFQKENESKIEDLKLKFAGAGLFNASTDFLVYLKIVLIEQIGQRLANTPPEWPEDWKSRVIAEIERRMAIEPKSIHDWFLLECFREALAKVPGQFKKDEQNVWETQHFKQWWAQQENKIP